MRKTSYWHIVHSWIRRLHNIVRAVHVLELTHGTNHQSALSTALASETVLFLKFYCSVFSTSVFTVIAFPIVFTWTQQKIESLKMVEQNTSISIRPCATHFNLLLSSSRWSNLIGETSINGPFFSHVHTLFIRNNCETEMLLPMNYYLWINQLRSPK